jgi:hypothetical protein
MKKINDGGPAFPRNGHPDKNDLPIDGMSIRDYFAAKAMQGLMSYTFANDRYHGDLKQCAFEAYEIADAMLAAREAGK